MKFGKKEVLLRENPLAITFVCLIIAGVFASIWH